ncbi:MAG TPA: hypothetical protein DD490_31410 [Acidobacteria bacterium]|nr:hypothetical protein [Acidobacteriota bacterium]
MAVVSLAQDVVQVDVDFYDEKEKEKLLRYPSAAAMLELVTKPCSIPMAEFLTYYLFHRKGRPSYRDYWSIGWKLEVAISHLDGCIEANGHSIYTAPGEAEQLTEVSQHTGEAIGLSVVNRIHRLTEADWTPIPRQQTKSLDFQLASDGERFIQVENKGSSVPDNRKLDERVRAQKRNITAKKLQLAEKGAHLDPAALRYGTITAVDPRQDSRVRCWLTDPPPDQIDEDPRRFRLLQRLRFLRDWISFVSSRSQLSAALATRVADLEAMRDPFELDNVPILRGNAEPFDFSRYHRPHQHSSFFSNKSRITDGPAGGLVVQTSPRDLFLVGIREELLDIAAKQNFDRVTSYRSKTGTVEKSVECVFSRGRLRTLRLPASIRSQLRETAGYSAFQLRGAIHYSPAGLVFGRLPLPSE